VHRCGCPCPLPINFQVVRINEVFNQLGPTPRLCIQLLSNVSELEEYEVALSKAVLNTTVGQVRRLFSKASELTMDTVSHQIWLVRHDHWDDVHSRAVVTPITPSIQSRHVSRIGRWGKLNNAAYVNTEVGSHDVRNISAHASLTLLSKLIFALPPQPTIVSIHIHTIQFSSPDTFSRTSCAHRQVTCFAKYGNYKGFFGQRFGSRQANPRIFSLVTARNNVRYDMWIRNHGVRRV